MRIYSYDSIGSHNIGVIIFRQAKDRTVFPSLLRVNGTLNISSVTSVGTSFFFCGLPGRLAFEGEIEEEQDDPGPNENCGTAAENVEKSNADDDVSTAGGGIVEKENPAGRENAESFKQNWKAVTGFEDDDSGSASRKLSDPLPFGK